MNHLVNLIRTIIGIVGNVTSTLLFLSPALTFWRIIKNKSVEDFQPYPYLAGVLNCFFWLFYALPMVHRHNTLIITVNSIGLSLDLSYLAIFFYFSPSKKQRLIIFLGLIGEAILATGVVLLTLLALDTTGSPRSTFVGIISVVFSITLYAYPLPITKKVIQTENDEFMPFWLCVAGFSNGIVWAVYALLRFDPFVLIDSGFAACLGLSQLCMHVIDRQTTSNGESGRLSEVQLRVATHA